MAGNTDNILNGLREQHRSRSDLNLKNAIELRHQARPGVSDRPLLSINTYFARAKFSPLPKKRDESGDRREQSIMLLYKHIRSLGDGSMEHSKPTFLLSDKSLNRPKKHAGLAITMSPFKDSQPGAEYLQLADKDPLSGLKRGAFKKNTNESQLRVNRDSNRNKKKSIKQFFASKNNDHQNNGKSSGTEPTLTKKLPTAEEVQTRNAKFLTESGALTDSKSGSNKLRFLNAKLDQMRTEINKPTNFKKKTINSKSIEKQADATSRQTKHSVTKERGKNSVQLVRSNTQTGHQKTVSQNALFCTKILDLLKKNKVMETGQSKLGVLKSKGAPLLNNLMSMGEVRRTATQKTETNVATPANRRVHTRITLSPDRVSQHNPRQLAKASQKTKLSEPKAVKATKSVKPSLKTKHIKTLSSNIVFARSTTNLHAHNFNLDHLEPDHKNVHEDKKGDSAVPKFSFRRSYKKAKTNVSEPTSRLTSIERTGFKSKRNASKDKTSRKSAKTKSRGTNMLHFINNIDSNQYLESLKAKLTGDIVNTKKQINLKSKLSLQNSKLLTLIGRFSDAAHNQEPKLKYRTCNNSRNEGK